MSNFGESHGSNLHEKHFKFSHLGNKPPGFGLYNKRSKKFGHQSKLYNYVDTSEDHIRTHDQYREQNGHQWRPYGSAGLQKGRRVNVGSFSRRAIQRSNYPNINHGSNNPYSQYTYSPPTPFSSPSNTYTPSINPTNFNSNPYVSSPSNTPSNPSNPITDPYYDPYYNPSIKFSSPPVNPPTYTFIPSTSPHSSSNPLIAPSSPSLNPQIKYFSPLASPSNSSPNPLIFSSSPPLNHLPITTSNCSFNGPIASFTPSVSPSPNINPPTHLISSSSPLISPNNAFSPSISPIIRHHLFPSAPFPNPSINPSSPSISPINSPLHHFNPSINLGPFNNHPSNHFSPSISPNQNINPPITSFPQLISPSNPNHASNPSTIMSQPPKIAPKDLISPLISPSHTPSILMNPLSPIEHPKNSFSPLISPMQNPKPLINPSNPPIISPVALLSPSISPISNNPKFSINHSLNPPINSFSPSISPSDSISNPPNSFWNPLRSPLSSPIVSLTPSETPSSSPTNTPNSSNNLSNPLLHSPINAPAPSMSPFNSFHTNPPSNSLTTLSSPNLSPSSFTVQPKPPIRPFLNPPTNSFSPSPSPSDSPRSLAKPLIFPPSPTISFTPSITPTTYPIDTHNSSINPSSPPINPPTNAPTPSMSPSNPFHTNSSNSPRPFGLQVGFYKGLCPNRVVDIEASITSKIQEHFLKDPTLLPAILRMQFHDCFVHGCDASILLDGPSTEKFAGPNLSVRGYEFIDSLKDVAEEECPGVVSCAYIIAIATKELIKMGGGPEYLVQTGRRDGLISEVQDVSLPSPFGSVRQSILAFSRRNVHMIYVVTIIILFESGAHTVGISQCIFFQDRLYQGTSEFDPKMDPNLRRQLIPTCPQGTNSNNFTFLDQNSQSSNKFDNSFFDQILKQRGILEIDQELARDPRTRDFVLRFARNAALFNTKFASVMVKMQALDVLLGDQGQIRKVCSKVN
ncbi:proline-rich extensin-like protein EPR1 [Chenopodium quinoa]|uniref:proline-rich extensin-like protein EPR1 n=1 Tax=Chenopodium quinoa TaxID=63459 RepID=UPI000B78E74B|nr:proline-rich extensin-like protein EPR1 [Chenopodium quinoa]